jgi:hypothetical protein
MKGRFLIFGIFVLTLAAFAAATTNVSFSEEVTISGRILPFDWDDDDKVTAVILVDDYGEEFIVKKNANGKELLKLIEKYVVATGTLSEDHEGNKIIVITQFTVSEE